MERRESIKYLVRLTLFILLIYVFPFLAAGCGTFGPSVIKGERINYNSAIQRTNDEQLLLNLVRLKYRDTPFFLEVSSVLSQLSISASAEAGLTLPKIGGNVLGLGSGATLADKPTVTYTPLQGEKFVQHLLTPVKLDTVLLLYHSGWSIKRIFALCFQRINGIINAPGASGPTPDYVPDYKEFAHLLDLFRKLQLKNALDIAYGASGASPGLGIRLNPASLDWKEVRELTGLLGVTPGKKYYPLVINLTSEEPDIIKVELRSLLGIMFYLSQSVEVPAGDREQGKITITRYSSGEPFDWSQVTGEILRIHSGSQSPEQAAVAVKYRNSWFYIKDSDLTSKSTFSLLAQLFALQSGKIKGYAPALTLPIGQ